MKQIVAEETMCCGYKRCPIVRIYDDGSVTITEDDGRRIDFEPNQARAMIDMLNKRMPKEGGHHG